LTFAKAGTVPQNAEKRKHSKTEISIRKGDIIAQEIVEDFQGALPQFGEIASDLKVRNRKEPESS
jgi:hypothetical protein